MSSSGISCRHAFSSALLEAARDDDQIYVLCSDSKGSVTLGDFEKALPGQFVEAGIAEQDAVSIGAGLAKAGKRVFVCGPACFYSARSLEQVKVDVAYAQSDVKIIGISGGVSYGALGSTHHALHDLAVMRTFPGLSVFLPCDNYQTAALTRYLATNFSPAYLRIGRGPVPDVYGPGREAVFVPGKAVMLHEGRDCAIVTAGEMVQHSLGAALLLEKEGIGVRVLDSWSVKPLDPAAIESAARDTGLVFTVEEHSSFGGLGSAVAELLVQSFPVPMKILGFPDEWAPAGSSAELFEHYGFTARKLAERIRAELSRKRKA
ncbi:MAG: transketolase C-terminal domain-containing protein [Spirochaetaceae bacterium]|nr:transketolase C-terminal domain-containing protein [Spirochaetaceae bacterium]